MTTQQPWIRVRGLSKSFLGVVALDGVDLDVLPGEVHGLIGQNGAGKSTLIKILAGVHHADAGSIEIEGTEVHLANAAQSAAAGIAVLHQEPQFVADLPVYENVYLGLRPPMIGPFLHRAAMRSNCSDILRRLGVVLDVNSRMADLPAAQKSMVSLARCLLLGARLIIMDEPTASLGAHEVEQVYTTVERLKAAGLSVIYVSHRLDEIAALCDRATVLRDGRLVASVERADLQDRKTLVRMILGTEPSDLVRAGRHTRGELSVRVEGLNWKNKVQDVSFDLHRGEVTGVMGFVGSGRSEVAHMLFGSLRPDSGTIEVDGRPLRASSPQAAIKRGIALLPEDRRHQGSFGDWTVRENLTLAALSSFSVFGYIQRRKERQRYASDKGRLGIKVASPESRFSHLSGGNQQKVVIAKWLATEADVFIFDEPTQGVDVGAQAEIHRLVRDIAAQNRAVLFISSDLEETLRISDRVLVMREGRVVGDLDSVETNLEDVLALCFGGVQDPLQGMDPIGDRSA
ncbi:sugar ABC transporter ATP-binding protein [Nocardioides sp.]|uniref:sugar ABC transporter ATP-binding protein n=1 Tax=Nocardioides sp. TaxID=35761 RepID=UPI003D0FF6E8